MFRSNKRNDGLAKHGVERRGLTFLEGAGERECDLLVFVLVVEPCCVDLWKTNGENVTQTSRALCGLGFGTFDETNSKLHDSGVGGCKGVELSLTLTFSPFWYEGRCDDVDVSAVHHNLVGGLRHLGKQHTQYNSQTLSI